MAGAEKIKSKILEEARQQAQFSIEEAEKQAQEILKKAEKEAEEKKSEIIKDGEEEAVERKKRIISVAELEARKMRLKAKQEAIEEVFKRTYQKIKDMPKDKYEDIMVKMILDSVKTGNEEVIISKYDKERLGNKFINEINKQLKSKGINNNVKLSKETRDINGGFILKEGEIEINNSFEVIIRMRRDELEAEVIKTLF